MFFPDNQPNYLNVFVELPVGTTIKQTNEQTALVKAAIEQVLNDSSAFEGGSYRSVYDVEKKIMADGAVVNDTIYFIESTLFTMDLIS